MIKESRKLPLVEGDSLAYFAISRRDDTPRRWHLGAIGHGPFAQQLAAPVIEQINVWNTDRTADPHLVAYPTGGTVPTSVEGKLIVKPNIRRWLGF